LPAVWPQRQSPIIIFAPFYDYNARGEIGGPLKFSIDDGLFENSLARPTLAQTAGNRSAHTQNCWTRIVSKNFAVDLKVNSNWGGHIPAF
jgi:hypothetical protein